LLCKGAAHHGLPPNPRFGEVAVQDQRPAARSIFQVESFPAGPRPWAAWPWKVKSFRALGQAGKKHASQSCAVRTSCCCRHWANARAPKLASNGF
jgi:hypothetical protein